MTLNVHAFEQVIEKRKVNTDWRNDISLSLQTSAEYSQVRANGTDFYVKSSNSSLINALLKLQAKEIDAYLIYHDGAYVMTGLELTPNKN